MMTISRRRLGKTGEVLMAPRMNKGGIAVALQKNFANEIDWHVDSLVHSAAPLLSLQQVFQ